MMYRIRSKAGFFSKGGSVNASMIWTTNKSGFGKFWTSKAALASHLAYITDDSQKFDRRPPSLFKIYGEATICEVADTMLAQVKEVPFAEWYENYYNTSEKFRPVRKVEHEAKATASILAKTPEPKIKSLFVDDALVAEPVSVHKPVSWDIKTKASVHRALRTAEKFVPNFHFEKMKEHPRNGETFAHIIIDGETFAVLKL